MTVRVPLKTITQRYYVLRDNTNRRLGAGALVPTGIKFDPDQMEETSETYREILLAVMYRAPKGESMDYAAGRKAMRVIDALDEADGKDFVELKSEDYILLKQHVEKFGWNAVTRPLMVMLDDVLGAEDAPAAKPAVQEGNTSGE